MPRIRTQLGVVTGVLALLATTLTAASAAPAPAAAAAAAAKPTPTCGSTIYKASGAAWRCTFADEFSAATLDRTRWAVQQTATSGYQNGGDCFVDNRNNVSVANGVLSLTTRRETAPVTCASPGGAYSTSWTSGMVSSFGTFSQTYGRFEIRAKFASAKVAGVHGALWLWPVDSYRYGAWPASGEIDIAESYSQYPDRAIPYVHYASSATDLSVTNNYCMIADPSAFHTYVAEWTPATIRITYDGQVCLDHTIRARAPLKGSAPFDQPFLLALTQSLGVGTNARTSATPSTASTVVDYVRVWS